ncbi:MAG TPA: DUF6714 family protein [Myxococcaceae bacterium]|nr:DUF6714 family protein [Myxococcaceae bacterium]
MGVTPRREQVVQAIEAAFADAPYPGDRRIGFDPDDAEAAQLDAHFRGLSWRNVPQDVLQRHADHLPFFSAEGLRYFLPAYLLAGLSGDTDTLAFTVYELEPGEGPLREHWLRRYRLLSPAQRNAVRLWLEYVREALPADTDTEAITSALGRVWSHERG